MTTPPKKPREMKNGKTGPLTLLSGFKDRLPSDLALWDHLSTSVERLGRSYGFLRIETPAVEDARLYAALDDPLAFPESERYSFVDAEEVTVMLRPETTLGMARAYREHGFATLPMPLRIFSQGPAFRFVPKPGAGTYRQFSQFNFLVFGDMQAVVDAQIIAALYFLFRDLQLDVHVRLNSIGHAECRVQYERLLADYYRTRRGALCDACKEKLTNKQYLQLFTCRVPECQTLMQEAPPIVDHLCDADRQHFVQVLEHLDEVDVSYELDPRLFRSSKQYNRTVVAFSIARNDGRDPLTLASGGRQDQIVSLVGGEPTPVFGIAGSLERLLMACKEQQIAPPAAEQPDVFLAQLGDAARRKSLRLFLEMRNHGIQVAESLSKEGIKGQLEMATRLKAKFALILGQKEIMDGTALIRDMENGIQEVVDFQKVIPELKKRLEKSKPSNVVPPSHSGNGAGVPAE